LSDVDQSSFAPAYVPPLVPPLIAQGLLSSSARLLPHGPMNLRGNVVESACRDWRYDESVFGMHISKPI